MLALPTRATALPPVAEFTSTPATPRIGEVVSFSSKSTDPDEDLSTQAWDLDGDGEFDDGTGFAVTASFMTGGPHTVSLQATDLAGGVGTVSHVVTVNFPPAAVIAFSPASPTVGQLVDFRSDSTDQDGTIVRTEWDLDNDGAFDDGRTGTAQQSFATAGLHVVRLLVRDDLGDEAIASAEVSVSDPVVTSAPAPAPAPAPPGGVTPASSPAPAPAPATTPARPAPAPATTPVPFASAGAPAVVAPQTAAAVRRPALLLSPFPIVHIRGMLVAGTIRLQLLTVRSPKGARIVLRCRGVTCPVRTVVRVARTGRTPVRFRVMERRRLRAGVVITIAVTKEGRIGKYTRFVLRRNAAPARRDMCMRYRATRPSACPVQ